MSHSSLQNPPNLLTTDGRVVLQVLQRYGGALRRGVAACNGVGEACGGEICILGILFVPGRDPGPPQDRLPADYWCDWALARLVQFRIS